VTFTPSRTLTPSLTHTPTITPTPAVIYYGRISAGNTGDSTCALQTTTGKVYCWGDHYYGGSVSNPEKVKIPRLVGAPAGVTFTKMVRASSHACAIATNGNTYCWGNNDQGQLGDGTLVHKTIANLVSMPTNPSTGAVIPFTSLSASQNATCALDSSGQAYCWGINTVGTLGDNTGVNSTTPVRVQMPAGVTFASLSENGSGHICALDSSGNAYCWGLNNKGQLGDGTNTNRLMPVPVSMPAGVAFSQITVGMFHTCAMTTGTLNKRIYCWGYNNVGQLGIGLAEDSPVPVLVTNPATNLFGVYAGGMHTCAIFQSGTYCWGLNTSGQLGDGTTTNSFTPVAVTMPGTAFFGHMSLGYAHSCAVTNSSIAYCWGRNTIGAVGDNTYTNRSIPVEVVQPDGTLPITPTPGGGGDV
jgi:alpha-tubulin suppressor-like RCC1 family protein